MELLPLLRAHAEWVVLLREALYGEGSSALPLAGNEEACPFGRWLVAAEGRYGPFPEYWTAKEIHSRFHRRAAYCLRLIDAGRRTEALAETEPGGELRRLSQALVQALVQLNRATHAARRHYRQLAAGEGGDAA